MTGRERFRDNQRNEEVAGAGLPCPESSMVESAGGAQCSVVCSSPHSHFPGELPCAVSPPRAEPRGEEGCIVVLTCYPKSCVL